MDNNQEKITIAKDILTIMISRSKDGEIKSFEEKQKNLETFLFQNDLSYKDIGSSLTQIEQYKEKAIINAINKEIEKIKKHPQDSAWKYFFEHYKKINQIANDYDIDLYDLKYTEDFFEQLFLSSL